MLSKPDDNTRVEETDQANTKLKKASNTTSQDAQKTDSAYMELKESIGGELSLDSEKLDQASDKPGKILDENAYHIMGHLFYHDENKVERQDSAAHTFDDASKVS